MDLYLRIISLNNPLSIINKGFFFLNNKGVFVNATNFTININRVMLTCVLRAQDKEPKSRNVPLNFVYSSYYKLKK